MKIELWQIGKTAFGYLDEGVDIYQKRLKHYTSFEILTIPDLKKRKHLSEQQIKEKEGEIILKKIEKSDFIILLDERGKTYTSLHFSKYIDKLQQQAHKRVIFLIGGAYGFSESIYQRANTKVSLSSMTFSHQMIRLFFVEQLYRAFTILNNEPYHHE